jgi:hypothetical protein
MQTDSKDQITPASKKVYSCPVLVEYGSIAKLTQGGASAGGDVGGMQAACL